MNNPIHEELLLLELKAPVGRHFTIGYYDAVMDVFCTWSYPGFIQTEDSNYDEMNIKKKGLRCVLPKAFELKKGARLIKGYDLLSNILDEIYEKDMLIEDIDGYLENTSYCIPHLLWLKNGRIIISETSCFCESGNQFEAFSPSKINGSIYHSGGPVPRDHIDYAVDLTNLEYEEDQTVPRMADVDKLFEAIRKNDLAYMQQVDVMICIRDTIERYLGNPFWDQGSLRRELREADDGNEEA